MKKFYKLLLISFIIFISVGCSSIQPTYKTNESIDRVKLKENYYLIDKNAKAEISIRFFAYIPLTIVPLEEDDRVNKLSEEILSRYNADILTDVRLETTWLFTVYYNTYTYILTASVWKKKVAE